MQKYLRAPNGTLLTESNSKYYCIMNCNVSETVCHITEASDREYCNKALNNITRDENQIEFT